MTEPIEPTRVPREDSSLTARANRLGPAAAVVGVLFLVVGALGFVPGVTTEYDALELTGPDSGAMLFGIFQVSVLHNVVHLLFGLVGLAVVRSPRAARAYFLVGGVLYLVLWVYGLVVAEGASADVVPLNAADDWLHLVLGVGMIALGLALSLGGRRTAAASG